MVASSINLHFNNHFIAGIFCRLSSCTIYLFLVLMRKIISILKNVAKVINKIVTSICLMIAYGIICIYCIFFKKKDYRLWYENNRNFNELDQTKHPW